MIQLTLPQIDSHSLLDSIIVNKNFERRVSLTANIDKIKERYKYYEENFNCLEDIHPETNKWKHIKDDLLSCYGSNLAFSKARKKLINSMPDVIKSHCPYCMLNRPNTLDHYFDKRDYPEFSIFIPNLVPCCSECNSHKGNSLLDSTGTRQYISFYHDILPDYQFVFIRFTNTIDDVVPYIDIYLDFTENSHLENIILAHFKNLKLIEKYKNSINTKLSIILNEITYMNENGFTSDDIYASLNIRFKSMTNNYGHNYWEACIYEGILNSTSFLNNVINSGIVPN